MSDEKLSIETRAEGPFMKNGYVLVCSRTGKAAYFDPGDEARTLLGWIRETGCTLVAIPLTHAHVDHVTGVGAVRAQWSVPIYLHPADRFLYDQMQAQAAAFGIPCSQAPAPDIELAEGQQLEVGDLVLDVRHTPGHSPGSVSFLVEDHVFCGDLIFAGSVGRTDLPGGDHRTLIRSIREKILPLGDDKILHSGHGPDTTVGRERRSNPFLIGEW